MYFKYFLVCLCVSFEYVLTQNCFVSSNWPVTVSCNNTESIQTISNKNKSKWITLNLSNSKINLIKSDDFNEISVVMNLKFIMCKIDRIDHNAFNGLQHLRRLDIVDSEIMQIELDWFPLNNTLEHFYIFKTSIENFSIYIIDRLINLLTLTLVDVSIPKISNITFPDNLEEIDLHSNDITFIESDIFNNLKKLQILNFNNNQISELKVGTFKGLNALKMLYLNENNIRNIAERSFQSLNAVVDLDLSRNSITIITKDMFVGLNNLAFLDISENDIKNIENQAFLSLNCLKKLNLGSNNLENLMFEQFVGLSQLEILKLNKNNIKNIQARTFANLPLLVELDLSANSLDNFQNDPFSEVNSKLKNLSLSMNNIKTIQPRSFLYFINLVDLNLDSNDLTNLPDDSFQGLTKLSILGLAHNYIEKMHVSAMSMLKTLTELRLHNNRFSFLPMNWFSLYRKLRSTTLKENPWQCKCLDDTLNELKGRNISFSKSHLFTGDAPVCFNIQESQNCIRDISIVYDSPRYDSFNRYLDTLYN